jgi:hypothetical protein
LKSTISTAPVAATSSISAGVHAGAASSLKREAERVHEPHGLRIAVKDLVQRPAGLIERQVERGGLERPVAPAPGGVPTRWHRPLLELSQAIAERFERPVPGERERGSGDVQGVRFALERRDVFAEAVDTLAE